MSERSLHELAAMAYAFTAGLSAAAGQVPEALVTMSLALVAWSLANRHRDE